MAAGPVPLWIDGKEVVTDAVFQVKAPASGKNLWTSSNASVAQALLAVEAASRAFVTWRKTKPGVIQKIFLKAADLYEDRREHILSLCMAETGMLRPLAELFHADTVAMIRDLSGRAANIHGAVPQLSEPGRAGFVLREPYGVIFSMAPWNAPLPLGTRAFAFALAAGNTAVFKGSELCPATFHELIRIFHEAGVPPGVLNSITVQPTDAAVVTQAVIEHAAVRKITFTGSTSVGRIVATMAGRVLKPTVMELGGKAAAIVCEDADLADAAFQCALGAFLHAGQICMSTERIIVHASVRDAFTAELKAAVAKVYPPEGALPVLATAGGADKTRALIDDAVAKGAEVILGPTADGVLGASMTPHNLHPSILAGVTPSMALHETESFGPSAALYYVDSDDAAVELANATVYGLAAAIFTRDLGRGLRLAKRLESGAVHINRMSVHDEPALPHGGVQDSGWGRFNGQWGVDEFLRWKTVTYVE